MIFIPNCQLVVAVILVRTVQETYLRPLPWWNQQNASYCIQ